MTQGDGKKRHVAVGCVASGPGALEPYLGPFTSLTLRSLIIKPINQRRCNQRGPWKSREDGWFDYCNWMPENYMKLSAQKHCSRNVFQGWTPHQIILALSKFVKVVGVLLFKNLLPLPSLCLKLLSVCSFPFSGVLRATSGGDERCGQVEGGGRVFHSGGFFDN